MSLLLLFGPPSVTGTAALAAPEPSTSAAGTLEFTGAAAIVGSEPTLSATGAETFSGSAALAVGEPAISASGEQTFTGTAALTTPEPTLAAAGSLEFTGSAALTIGQPSIAASGTLEFSGSAALTTPEPTIDASGTYTPLAITGTADLAVSEPAITAAAVLEFAASADLSVATPALAAVGSETFSGSAALDVAEPSLAADATLTFTGTASLDASTPGLSATGSLTFVASAALSVPEPALDASGTYTPLAISGAAALQVATPAITVAGVEAFVAGCAEYGSAVYGQSTFGCTGNTNLTVPTPTIGASGVTAAFIGTVALSVPEPTIAAAGSEIFVAGCAEYGTAVYGQSTFGCTGNTNLDVPAPSIGGIGSVTATVAEPPKAGGKSSRARPLLTRYRRESDPRFLHATVTAPQPRVQAQLHAEPAPRRLSSVLRGPRPSLQATGAATHARHLRAALAAAQPRLQARGRYLPTVHVTASVYAPAPYLQARLVHTPEESWLLTLMLADSFTSMAPTIRSVDVCGGDGDETLLVAAMLAQDVGTCEDLRLEATKRLSDLQRESNAQVARTDSRQNRIVQAALPHLLHAFSAQRDAVLVALPHAAKASVDPEYVLNDQGFLNAVALLIQAIEDIQQTGVTLGYTDAAPPDAFDLSSPYIDAAITQLATRITGITDTTAQAIRDVIAQGLSEGWSVAEMGTAIQDLGAFSDARALMIAATESRVALNNGNAAAWQDMGVEEVLIADGDYDEVCAELDGSTVSLEWYMANPVGHPNCRRSGTAIPTAVPV